MRSGTERPIEVDGAPQLLEFRLPSEMADFYVLSPFATYRAGKYEMVVRLVNRDEDPAKKISRIHYATSEDGVRFKVGREVIAPGDADEPDSAGCEDPTVTSDGESYIVFYSGYNARQKRSLMLAASGRSLDALHKRGPMLLVDESFANPKEAALVATSRGFRMFFEYARDGASHIGVADATQINGPWTYGTSPLEPRSQNFDSWHLSPSSAMRRVDGTHVLFYNGASRETAWRINYVILDETATIVLERPKAPLVHPFNLQSGDSDIAFAASAILDSAGAVWLYYSIADRTPYRSQIVIEGAVGDSAI